MRLISLCLLAGLMSAEEVSLALDEPCDGGYREAKAIDFLDGHAYTQFFDGATFIHGEQAYLAADVIDVVAYINQAIEVMPPAEEFGRYRRIQIHVKDENGIRHGIRWINEMIPIPAVMNHIGVVGIAAHNAH